MALFGGSKSRSSTSSTEIANNTADNRVVESANNVAGNVTLSNAGRGAAGTFNVTTTDFGALDIAEDIAQSSLVQVQNSVEAVQTIAGDAGTRINDALKKVADFATSATGSDQNKTIQILIIAAAVVGAFMVYKKRA